MKKFSIRCSVLSVDGYQIWSVLASNEKEAPRLFEKGDGIFVDEEIEVKILGEPEVTKII